MEEGRPRIAPGSWREIGLVNSAIARAAGLRLRTGPPNIFTTLGRHRAMTLSSLRVQPERAPGDRS